MDAGILIGVLAFGLTCFMAGVQYGKDHRHEE